MLSRNEIAVYFRAMKPKLLLARNSFRSDFLNFNWKSHLAV